MLVGTPQGRPDDHEDRADQGAEDGDDQHLGADEELEDDEAGEREAVEPRPPALGHQEVGQDQDDEGWDGQEGDVELVEGQLGHHEGREAVGQATDERRRCPPHPPAQQHEHGERRQGGREGEGHVHGGDRARHPGDRGQHHGERHHAGVVEQVDAGRVEQVGRIEDVMPVGEGDGRPAEVPEEAGRVAAAARRDRRRVRGPRVPPQPHTEHQVGDRRSCQAPPSTGRRRPTVGRLHGRGGGRVGGRRRHDPAPTDPHSCTTATRGSALNCRVVNPRLSPMLANARPRDSGAVMACR